MPLLQRSRIKALQPTQFDQGRSKTLPAPVGGLNLRDDINDLEPHEALVLDNWLPEDGSLHVRDGHSHHASGMGLGEVKTVATFSGYSANAMLAGANAKIYDVTSATYGATGNDTYTKVLLEFDGADALTTFTDTNAGGSAHTWTAAGNAQIDTAQSKFGGSSGLFDGTGDWVTTPDHADFTLDSDEFTIDFWFNCNAAGGTAERLAGQAAAGLAAATGAWYIERHTTDVIRAHVSNGSAWTTITGTTTFTSTDWHHVALVRTADTLKLFIDGTQEGGDTAFSGSVNDSANALRVGAAGEETTDPWTGWVDEFRLSVGAARWAANFTPPTARYAPPSLATGFSQDRWQTALYSDRLFFVNGTDTPQVYNGSTVAAIAWAGAGLTNTNLINIALVRNRLWFAEANQAWAWYGAIGQITAASNLTKFQLEQIAGGGYLMAMGSWSRDGGEGADDLTVFIMSTGEIIVYQGDPGGTFTLIGKFHGAPPIGRRCLFQVGGELVVITTQGLLPMSVAIGGSVTAQDITAIDPWGKVAPGIAADAKVDAIHAGWQGIFHRGYVWLNVPQEPAELSKQYVLNTRTGAWTNFSNLDGSCFCVFADGMYFGGMDDGTVYAMGGANDDEEVIAVRAVSAFVYPTGAQTTNLYTAARPRILCDGTMTGRIGVFTDFHVGTQSGAVVSFSSSSAGSSEWDIAEWDVAEWADAPTIISQWHSVTGEGKAVAVAISANAGTNEIEWYSTDILYKRGGIK